MERYHPPRRAGNFRKAIYSVPRLHASDEDDARLQHLDLARLSEMQLDAERAVLLVYLGSAPRHERVWLNARVERLNAEIRRHDGRAQMRPGRNP